MKISFKHQTKEKNIGSCTVIEHDLNHEMLDIAIAKITGRYPETRRVVNQQCNELAYVYAGSGKIVVNGQIHLLNAGDAVLVEAGEKYYWEGDMEVFISCRPAWHIEQHEIVD